MDSKIVYRIIRSRRKTISIIIEPDCSIVVRAPLRCSKSEINELVEKKQKWILSALERVKKSNSENAFSLVDGEKLILLGEEYTICIVRANNYLCRDHNMFLPFGYEKHTFRKLACRLLKEYIISKAEHIAKMNGFNYKRISITLAKKRWGSCGAGNTLNFSCALVFMPTFVVDYVIYHELCHTREKNHSSRFWALVKSVCPDYESAEQVLKSRAAIMNYL